MRLLFDTDPCHEFLQPLSCQGLLCPKAPQALEISCAKTHFRLQKVIIPYVDIPKLEGKITSYKGLIIEWCQKKKKKYCIEVYEDTGNESIKHFSVKISIDGNQIAKGRATSKKKAEEQASKRVYFTFQKEIENI